MSGIVRHRHPWRRFVRYGVFFAVAAALTTTLALAVQVRRVRVTGAEAFPVHEVEEALVGALGERVIATSAESMRDHVLAVPWVEDAVVRLSLDGTVSCQIVERRAVAVALDGGSRELLDARGTLLGDHEADSELLTVRGFGPYPTERAAILQAVPQLERCWGQRVMVVERLGPADVGLQFAETPFVVVADPGSPSLLTVARAVATAWSTRAPAPPQRVDARVSGRVVLVPAPVAPADPEGAA